jgi:hypothetical protein
MRRRTRRQAARLSTKRSSRSRSRGGSIAAYLEFHGYQTSTMNFQTFSQVAFAFQVTPELLAMGLSYASLPARDGDSELLPVTRRQTEE